MIDTIIGLLVAGLADWTWWQMLIFFLVTYHLTVITVTVYLHRHMAHQSVDLNPVLRVFFRLWLYFGTGMDPREWTAVHRKHHAVCETEEDPHSPKVYGIKRVLIGGAELYGESIIDNKDGMLEKYTRGCPDNWFERNIFQNRHTGIMILLGIEIILFGFPGMIIWAGQMMSIPVMAAGVINGIGHYWGYRNYESPDMSKNIVPWGIIVGGEELHSNHHTYPNSAKFSSKWWEFDLGWFYICLFSFLGLAKVHHAGRPATSHDKSKSTIDINTAMGAINDRFRIMADYANKVVNPLIKDAMKHADVETKSLLKGAKRLLCQDPNMVTDEQENKQKIEQILNVSDRLRTVYQLKLDLQKVWKQRVKSRDEIMSAFKAWMDEAENSGINVVKDFASYLKTYTLPAGLRIEEAQTN